MYPTLLPKSNADTILKKGPLQKKGKGLIAGWSTRYFVLKRDGDFAYYGDRNFTDWRGNIDLQRVSKIVRKDKKTYARTLQILELQY